MLDRERYRCVLNRLADLQAEQMLITDPISIFWICGKWIHPGERFLGLLIRRDKAPIIFVNRLFEFKEDIGIRIIWFTDTDNVIELLKSEIDSSKVLGVDKILQSRFLIPLIECNAAKGFINSSQAVDFSRACKTEEEKELMRYSSKINDTAMGIFKNLVHEGVTEKEIADQMLGIYQSLGASGFSFDPIVSFGKNAADPHHSPDSTLLQEGDCVLFDIGCIYKNYCSDMTRTFYYKREPDHRLRTIYNLVRKANEEAEAMVKAGIPLKAIDLTARKIIEEGGYGINFNHRLGHFIGLEDHEFGDVSSVNDKCAETNNIFSIEPGIYLAEDTGVRIEDLVIVRENDCEVLNKYSKELEIIE